jgi:hypothetical protein
MSSPTSPHSPDFLAPSGHTTGTLSDAALPGAAFDPDEYDVELSQTSLAEADEILKATLDEAMIAVGGNRAFFALVDMKSGELVLRFTAGEGWTGRGSTASRQRAKRANRRFVATRNHASRRGERAPVLDGRCFQRPALHRFLRRREIGNRRARCDVWRRRDWRYQHRIARARFVR